MKTKRIFTLFGLLAVATIGLAACSSGKQASNTEKKVVEVATVGSPKPFIYEGKDGKITGYEAELVREIFKGLDDYKPHFTKTAWASMFAGLDSDRYQVAINNISYTKERAEKYLYSYPIASNPLSLIVPKNSDIKGLDDLGGKTTEVVPGSSTAALLDKFNTDHPNQPTKVSHTQSLIAEILSRVNDGKTDYKLFEGIAAQSIIKDQGLTNLKVINLPADSKPYIYILFSKSQKDLQKKVNQRIKELYENGTLKKLSKTYLGGEHLVKKADLK